MQGYLRRLAHRTDKQTDTNNRKDRQGRAGKNFDGLTDQLRSGCKCLSVVQGACIHYYGCNAQQEAKVAYPVDQKGFEVGENCCGLFVPEPDQQIGYESDCLPTEKQLQIVVGHHQHQHRKGEQRNITEESLITRIFMHIANGVDVHHQRHGCHHCHHDNS